MTTTYHPEVLKTCAIFGCTPMQALAQYRANAVQLRAAAEKAQALPVGRKFRGAPAEVWAERAAKFEEIIAG
jgi:hypothetical protein